MIKRFIDIFISAISLLLISPIIVVLACIIRYKLGNPVFFRQIRPGQHAQPFHMFKFRTMQDILDPQGKILSDEKRLTSFGSFLRSTSLDELPELWNVLKGNMSLVGPRPLLMEYLPLYSAEQTRRMEVRPGITGWAQINGRNAISWNEKFKLDIWYIDHQSFWLDIKILFLTMMKVFSRSDITAEGNATAPKFTGK